MTYREPGKQKPSSDEDQLEIPCASDYRDIMHTFADGGFDPEFNKRRIKLILESVKKNMQKILVESQEHATSETSTVRIKIKLPVSRNECVHSAEQTHKAIRKSFGDVMLLLQKEGGWENTMNVWWHNGYDSRYYLWPFCNSTKVDVTYTLILQQPKTTG